MTPDQFKHVLWAWLDVGLEILFFVWVFGWLVMALYSKLRAYYREYILEIPINDDSEEGLE